MIHLVLYTHVSLHEKNAEARAALVEEIRAQLRCPLERRLYRCEIVLHGHWVQQGGQPTSRNTDNILKMMFDCLAEAGGLGKNGRGDEFLDRDFSVKAVQSDCAYAEITLN